MAVYRYILSATCSIISVRMNHTTKSDVQGKQNMQFEEVSNRISDLRNSGNVQEAIKVAIEAIDVFPNSYFFPKVGGDLFFQIGDYPNASKLYLQFLKRTPPNQKLFNDFAKRYYRLKRSWSRNYIATYARTILNDINKGGFSYNTAVRATELIKDDIPPEATYSETAKSLENSLSDAIDANFNPIVRNIRLLESQNPAELFSLLDSYLLKTTRAKKTRRIDTFVISVYEKNEKYQNALKLASDLLYVTLDPIVIRAMLRLSRKLGNYAMAQAAIARHPQILRSESFNVLYELVYYYEYLNDLGKIKTTLLKMEKRSSQSIPILSTLRNFYLKFGLYDDAHRVDELSVKMFQRKGRERPGYLREIEESAKEFRSEFEHRTRLAAISDLTTGISHELGQPITNIRYTVQFYKQELEKNLSKEQMLTIFDSILEETERMGQLVKRLAPITSTKTLVEEFDVVDRIARRLQAESARLEQAQIHASIRPSAPLYMRADPVKFDQIISNLLLNSIDAIEEKASDGKRDIDIKVTAGQNEYEITFTDTGVGIPVSLRGRMFEPFFSTKPPGKGSGLGLFIVWNIAKMFGGSATLDSNYVDGTRFVVTIPRDTTNIE